MHILTVLDTDLLTSLFAMKHAVNFSQQQQYLMRKTVTYHVRSALIIAYVGLMPAAVLVAVEMPRPFRSSY